MFQRLDRADREHGEQRERHIGRAEVLQHVARQGEGQALTAEGFRRGNRVPALLDIGVVSLPEPVGQAHHAVFKASALQITDAVQGREFSGGELADSLDDGFDQIRFGMGEAIRLGKLLDPGIDADGEQLVGGGRGKGGHGKESCGAGVKERRCAAHLAGRAPVYSAWPMSGKNVTEVVLADAAGIAKAVQILESGGLVAVPTETVYGLAARADSAEAVAKIYAAKGRPDFNPLIVHVRDAEQAAEYAEWLDEADLAAGIHWPGPLTLVLPKRDEAVLAEAVTAGLPTVALRAPSSPCDARAA